MLRKLSSAFFLLVVTSSIGLAQSRTLYIGDVELRLGMPRDAAMKILTTKYLVSVVGRSTFSVSEYDEVTKSHNLLGTVEFDADKLSYIGREINTTGWPNDEGFAVARGIYEAIHGSIPLTDRDGAKRATVSICVGSQEAGTPRRGTLRSIDIYVNQRKIAIIIFDGPDGKSVSASVTIRAKPW